MPKLPPLSNDYEVPDLNLYSMVYLFLFFFISEKYQGKFKECRNCDARIDLAAKGKYNYRDSKDFYHFCTGKCLEEYKSNQKPYCLSCNKSEIEGEGVLAPVGSKEFHNFCDQKCLDAYSIKVGKKSNSGKKSIINIFYHL